MKRVFGLRRYLDGMRKPLLRKHFRCVRFDQIEIKNWHGLHTIHADPVAQLDATKAITYLAHCVAIFLQTGNHYE